MNKSGGSSWHCRVAGGMEEIQIDRNQTHKYTFLIETLFNFTVFHTTVYVRYEQQQITIDYSIQETYNIHSFTNGSKVVFF